MNPFKMETESMVGEKTTQAVHPPTPPSTPPMPPPLSRFWVRKSVAESVTKQEIARFWKQKRIDKEDHLLAAIKAAARIRARKLSEEDYKLFEESLKDDDDDSMEKKENNIAVDNDKEQETKTNEVRVGIKDWWTKSKYAYLNQPAIESMDNLRKKRTSSYVPNCFTYKPVSLYPTSLGVF